MARHLQAVAPDTKILIYSGHGAFPYVRKAFDDGGVMAYINKDDPDTCVIQAINWVRDDKRYMSPRVMHLSKDLNTSDLAAYLTLYEKLTDYRERITLPACRRANCEANCQSAYYRRIYYSRSY